jgi:CheY-like chemotaxis protein
MDVKTDALCSSAARRKVLVVEDEAIIAMHMEKILRSRGCEIAGLVASGEESIAQAERLQPDLVFMDIGLKGSIDGFEAGRQIRSRFHIPVVFLTSHGEDIIPDPPAAKSDFPRVLKPFEEHEIEGVLRRFLPGFSY